MKPIYRIEYRNRLFNMWIPFNQLDYKTLESAKKEVEDYKENIKDLKIRIIKVEVCK
jgi:hypothetical protein